MKKIPVGSTGLEVSPRIYGPLPPGRRYRLLGTEKPRYFLLECTLLETEGRFLLLAFLSLNASYVLQVGCNEGGRSGGNPSCPKG